MKEALPFQHGSARHLVRVVFSIAALAVVAVTASGAADAAYYVGECKPCGATLSNVVATLSAVGYSGTNASNVVIRDSVWDRNGAGIVPNTSASNPAAKAARNPLP